MFRHKDKGASPTTEPVENSADTKDVKKTIDTPAPMILSNDKKIKEFSLSEVGDLLQKNLKWSQIIYEQNRRLNSKFFWMALASWLRIFLIVAVLAVGLWFLPPLLGNIIGQYQAVLGEIAGSGGKTSSTDSAQKLLQMLPINSAQQEQIKALLK